MTGVDQGEVTSATANTNLSSQMKIPWGRQTVIMVIAVQVQVEVAAVAIIVVAGTD